MGKSARGSLSLYETINIYENDYLPNNIVDENLEEFLSSVVACLKVNDTCLIGEPPKMFRSSVNDLTLFEVWMMSKDERMIRIQPDRCKEEVSKEIAFQPIGLNPGDHWASISINLYATDEQIKEDFNQWLIHARKATNNQRQKKLFTQADFDYWIEYGVIPYLDLMLIARIEGKKITQNKLARLIFPDEYDVDVAERLRKVTKPTAQELLSNEVHQTLLAQFSSEKANGIKNA